MINNLVNNFSKTKPLLFVRIAVVFFLLNDVKMNLFYDIFHIFATDKYNIEFLK